MNNSAAPSTMALVKKVLTDEERASLITLFNDQYNTAHAFINDEAVTINSKRFRQIIRAFYLRKQEILSRARINVIIEESEARAYNDGLQNTLFNRVGLMGNDFYYDLGNKKVVRITPAGWTIEDPPILFRRYNHQQQQVIPVSGGNPFTIFYSLNVKREHQLLMLVYLISCFIPNIQHPILHLNGSQGSGKSTASTIIRTICDPSNTAILQLPADRNQLVQILNHHYMPIFDNLSSLGSDQSDIFSQACTGSGISKRMLYTNDDDIFYNIKHCVGLNGINLTITKPDLMERSILISLESISCTARKTVEELWGRFEGKRPGILGGIFDVVSRARHIYPSLRLGRLQRMADFTKWGYAIAEALYNQGEAFLEAYEQNISRQHEEILSGNLLAQAIVQFMNKTQKWSGTVQTAYRELRKLVDKTDNTFPSHPNKMRRHLGSLEQNLSASGIKYTLDTSHRMNGVHITFEK